MRDTLCILGIAAMVSFLLGFAWVALTMPMP